MRILVAPDKFRDSLGAGEVAQSIALGLRDVLPQAEITLLPLADGGEGTTSVICAAADGEWRECNVHDPLGRPVSARYCTIASGAIAIMEMSEASGLWRLAPNERDPLRASSFGTGELLLDARRGGAKEIIIGLGGSATNDGGFGMARALGYRFFGSDGIELCGGTMELLRLERIIRPAEPWTLPITAAVDVSNPLLGANGATWIFAPQKGASPQHVEILEQALTRLAEVIAADLECDFREVPSAGAAGGLGFGLLSFCSAKIRSGFEVVAEAVDLRSKIAAADAVATGEGKLDAQTVAGKVPAGVARLAHEAGKAVFAIVGQRSAGAGGMFDLVLRLAEPPVTEAEAMVRAAELLRERARELARSLLARGLR